MGVTRRKIADLITRAKGLNVIHDNEIQMMHRSVNETYERSRDSLESQGIESHHETFIFPEDTDETVTFTASNVANTFGAWAEIVDNNAVTLSSKFASNEGHISAVMVEDVSVKEKTFLIEIAYGASKIIISRHRFVSGETTKLPPIQQIRVRSLDIPAGETVYYRMKCDQADATCELSFRYHYH